MTPVNTSTIFLYILLTVIRQDLKLITPPSYKFHRYLTVDIKYLTVLDFPIFKSIYVP